MSEQPTAIPPIRAQCNIDDFERIDVRVGQIIALGFRNLTNHITRGLLDNGGFRPRIHSLLR